MDGATESPRTSRPALAFSTAVPIAVLGGLIGLGGAEFRLPVLDGLGGHHLVHQAPVQGGVERWRLLVEPLADSSSPIAQSR